MTCLPFHLCNFNSAELTQKAGVGNITGMPVILPTPAFCVNTVKTHECLQSLYGEGATVHVAIAMVSMHF